VSPLNPLSVAPCVEHLLGDLDAPSATEVDVHHGVVFDPNRLDLGGILRLEREGC
jgi:hypothetical protein